MRNNNFYYRTIRLKDLPEEIAEPLALCISEINIPCSLLIECSPEDSEITHKSHIAGYCSFDPAMITVVIRELDKTVSTIYHEARHYQIHLQALKEKGWMPPSKLQLKIIEGVLESDADKAGKQGLKAFKAKHPLLFENGLTYSKLWLQENNFSEYNSKQDVPLQDMITDCNRSIEILRNLN